jgi:hypothetical protein
MAQKSHKSTLCVGDMIFQKHPPKMFFFRPITSCHDVTHGECYVQLWAHVNIFKLKKSLYGHQPLFRFSSQTNF